MPEVNSAEVVKGDGQETEIEVTANAGAEQAGGADTEQVDSETDRPPKKGGWLRKLEKAERQRDELIQALARVGGNAGTEQKTVQNAEEKPPVKPIRPKESDFNGDQAWEKWQAAIGKYEDERDSYYEAKLAWEIKQGLSKSDQEKQKRSERQTVTDGFAKQCDDLRKEHDDFDAVAFSKSTPMSEAMQEAILTSDHGAAIAYELGQDPDEAERIAHLPPVSAVREIGKIEARIASKKSAAEDDEEAEDTPEPPKAASQAPKPPARVGRPTSVNSEPDDKEPYDKWLKKRNAQLRK